MPGIVCTTLALSLPYLYIDSELVTNSTPSEPPALRGANLDLGEPLAVPVAVRALGGWGLALYPPIAAHSQLHSQLTLWKRQATLECDGLVCYQ